MNEAGSSQNEMLFMRGNAMSGAPIISGTIQLPKPPIIAGITMKKIMIRPCAVVNTLYRCEACSPWKNVHSRMHQFDANRDRQQAADQSAHDGEHQVHRADVLVIGRIDKAAPSGRCRMIVRIMRAVSRCRSSHVQLPQIYRCRPRFGLYWVLEPSVAATLVAGLLSSMANFFFASASHAAYACSFTTRTSIGMKAWSLPQSSEHWP